MNKRRDTDLEGKTWEKRPIIRTVTMYSVVNSAMAVLKQLLSQTDSFLMKNLLFNTNYLICLFFLLL